MFYMATLVIIIFPLGSKDGTLVSSAVQRTWMRPVSRVAGWCEFKMHSVLSKKISYILYIPLAWMSAVTAYLVPPDLSVSPFPLVYSPA